MQYFQNKIKRLELRHFFGCGYKCRESPCPPRPRNLLGIVSWSAVSWYLRDTFKSQRPSSQLTAISHNPLLGAWCPSAVVCRRVSFCHSASQKGPQNTDQRSFGVQKRRHFLCVKLRKIPESQGCRLFDCFLFVWQHFGKLCQDWRVHAWSHDFKSRQALYLT